MLLQTLSVLLQRIVHLNLEARVQKIENAEGLAWLKGCQVLAACFQYL